MDVGTAYFIDKKCIYYILYQVFIITSTQTCCGIKISGCCMLQTVLHSDFFLALSQFIFLEVLSVEYQTGPHEHHMTPPLSASPGRQVKTLTLYCHTLF